MRGRTGSPISVRSGPRRTRSPNRWRTTRLWSSRAASRWGRRRVWRRACSSLCRGGTGTWTSTSSPTPSSCARARPSRTSFIPTASLAEAARKVGEQFQTVEAAIEVNDRQFGRVVDKIEKGLGSLEDKAVAVLGLSFKPNTDDVRESRSLKICEALLAAKCKLRVFDPVAMAQARRVLNDAVTYCSDCYEAVTDCDA